MASSRTASPSPMRALVAALDTPLPALSGLGARLARRISIQHVPPPVCADHAARLNPAVVILDGRIPGVMRILQDVRSNAPMVGVLFVADALSTVAPAMAGGASDWVMHDASPGETLLRLELLAAQAGRPLHTTRVVGSLRLDRGARSLAAGDRRLVLTPMELKVFERLLTQPGHPVSRAELRRSVWPQDDVEHPPTNIEVVYVSYLRKKLAKLGGACSIRTVTNVGYALDVEAAVPRGARRIGAR